MRFHSGLPVGAWLTQHQRRHDVMNDMAFGGGSEMLRDGDLTGHWALVESGMRYHYPLPALQRISDIICTGFSPLSVTCLGLHGSLC